MTFIIFLIILGVLVFVHELGHFLLAKKASVKVEEFGFGYPPRAFKIGEKWGTLFTLNWIPFGGFVKIFGEDYEDDLIEKKEQKHTVPALGHEDKALGTAVFVPFSFTQASKKWQVAILAAGVFFNIIFAWMLFSFGFLIGMPTSADNSLGMEVKNPILTVIGVSPNSPAQSAGIKSGDKIKSIALNNGEIMQNPTSENASKFINKSTAEVLLKIDRGGKIMDFEVLPKINQAENPLNQSGQAKKIIGINMDMVGILSLPLPKAIYEGGRTTLEISFATIKGIYGLVRDALRGKANISNVAGPVGIIGLVGDASRLGFAYLITFTALISINLAIINLVPFPALDGGRIVFVVIEAITKRKISPHIAQTLNTIGFFILITLMLVITYRDILKLF